MKIGVMFGSPETTTGGHALKFYSSVRLDIRRIGQVKDGDRVVASRARVKVVKNKVAPPFGEAEIEIRFGGGVNRSAEVLELGAKEAIGVVDKNGAWYLYRGERLGQGRDKAAAALDENQELRERIVEEILARAAAVREPAAAVG